MTTNTMDLYCDNVLSIPQDFDWSEGYGETWTICRPDFWSMEACQLFEYADDYGVTLDGDPRELSRAELIEGLESIGVACYDEESDCLLAEAYGDSMLAGDLGFNEADNWPDLISERFEDYDAPVMSYRYPIHLERFDGSASEAAAKLDGLPLCLIEDIEEGEFYLALTGGGMDLSAEICRAYIALGQRPPVHFCRVPRMAGRKYSQDFLRVLIESCEVSQSWAQSTIHDLRAISADTDYSEAQE